MINLKKTSTGNFYLDLPAFKELGDARQYFEQVQNTNAETRYFNALQNFLNFCIAYCDKHVKNITMSIEQAITIIFDIENTHSNTEIAYARLHTAKRYAMTLTKKITQQDIANCRDLTFYLTSDYEYLFIFCEQVIENSEVNSQSYHRKFSLCPRDILFSSIELLFPYNHSQNNSGNYFDTMPYVAIQTRQLIERLINNAIGIDYIENSNTHRPHHNFKNTLEFFCKNNIGSNYSITYPGQGVNIANIYTWTNAFVHDEFIGLCFDIYTALDYVCMVLLDPPAKNITIYNNYCTKSLLFGDIKIENYHNLKVEFEKIISPNGKLTIHWLPIDEVGAYILSL